jgi:hypothetical protein
MDEIHNILEEESLNILSQLITNLCTMWMNSWYIGYNNIEFGIELLECFHLLLVRIIIDKFNFHFFFCFLIILFIINIVLFSLFSSSSSENSFFFFFCFLFVREMK